MFCECQYYTWLDILLIHIVMADKLINKTQTDYIYPSLQTWITCSLLTQHNTSNKLINKTQTDYMYPWLQTWIIYVQHNASNKLMNKTQPWRIIHIFAFNYVSLNWYMIVVPNGKKVSIDIVMYVLLIHCLVSLV